MKLTHHPKDRWFSVLGDDRNQIGGRHWSLGEALETSVRYLNDFYSVSKLSIWEAEGTGSSCTQTMLLTVFRNGDIISIRGEEK